jgi:hypothetical protein
MDKQPVNSKRMHRQCTVYYLAETPFLDNTVSDRHNVPAPKPWYDNETI